MQDYSFGGFVKNVKCSKRFDDGSGGRQNNKKNDFHRKARANGQSKKSFE